MLKVHRPAQETAERIREAVRSAIPDATVEVAGGGGGHFDIRVRSAAFAGKNRLARQRLVYQAIAALLAGDQAPVHAVDRLETLAPDEPG